MPHPLWCPLHASCFIWTFGHSNNQTMVLRNHWVKTATLIILDNLHSPKYNLLVHSTQTSLLTLNSTSQPLKCSGPFVARAFPGFINLLVHKRPQHLTVLPQVLLDHSIPLLRQKPSSQIYLPGLHREGFMWIPQKSVLLPLERNSHDYRTWVLSPQGLIGNYIHSLALRLPCSHPLLIDNQHDAPEFQGPQQGRNACFSHSAGHSAPGIQTTLLEPLK